MGLVDENNKELSQIHFSPESGYFSDPPAEINISPYFSFRMAWNPETTAIILLNENNEVLVRQTVSKNAPSVTWVSPQNDSTIAVDKDIKLKWNATDPDDDLLIASIQMSTDNGEHWSPILEDIDGNQVVLKKAFLPSKGQLLIRITITDGVNIANEVILLTVSEAGTTEKNINKVLLSYMIIVVFVLLVAGLIFMLWRRNRIKKNQ
jgi:hypothetical protein